MAVAPGNTILPGDMAALSGAANSKGSLSFLTNPCYQDQNTGANIGYGQYATINIASRGAGYKPEDVVGLGNQQDPPPTSAQYRVMIVDVNGGILVMRVVSNGQIGPVNNSAPYWNQPSQPQALTGGSGHGATVTCSITQYGPEVLYSFPPLNINEGTVTGIYLISGGVAYEVNDQISIPAILGFNLSVPLTLRITGVDGSGAITSWTIVTEDSGGYTTLPLLMATVPAAPLATAIVSSAHGVGATFGPYALMSPIPAWAAELTRLRLDMQTPSFQGDLSGPWPISGYTNFLFYGSGSVEFYYPDNGSPQSVSLGSPYTNGPGTPEPTVIGATAEEYISAYFYDLAHSGSTTSDGPFTSLTWEIVIGGNQDVTFNGGFQISSAPGWTISVTTNFPGLGGFTQYEGSVSATVANQTVAPGTYQLQATCSGGTIGGLNTGMTIYPVGSTALIGLVASGSTGVPGIDGTTDIQAITGCTINTTSGLGFGIWGKAILQGGTVPAPPEQIFISGGYYDVWWESNLQLYLYVAWLNPGYVSYAATCYGLFTGKTPPVSNLNAATPSVMPWNTIVSHHGGGGLGYNWSYNPSLGGGAPVVDNTGRVYQLTTFNYLLPIEEQLNPPMWQANRQIPLGFTILDSNGNFQKAISAGLTGTVQPGWPLAAGAQTQEIVIFQGVAGVKGVNWQLSKVMAAANKILPAATTVLDADTGLPLKVPRYPSYWSNETIARLKPPVSALDTEVTIFGTGSQWNGADGVTNYKGWNNGNKALGWWIYSLRLNRYGLAGKNGVILPQAGQIAAQVGCMRNGAFVSFGTFQTGQNYNVLWPIFTSDALVYQAAERLDLQAISIATGAAGVTTGPTIQSPICAAHYTDTMTLLNLII